MIKMNFFGGLVRACTVATQMAMLCPVQLDELMRRQLAGGSAGHRDAGGSRR